MMRSRFLLGLVVAVVVAVGTWLAGWWAAIVVGAVVGLLERDRGGRAGTAGLGAAGGWALLLAVSAAGGRFGTVAGQLAGVMQLPWPVLMLVTLAIPLLLAWGAAALVASLVGRPAAQTTTSFGP